MPVFGIEERDLFRLSQLREQFGNFELRLEWKISEAGNSGIFIRGDESGGSIHHTGFEMQVFLLAGLLLTLVGVVLVAVTGTRFRRTLYVR